MFIKKMWLFNAWCRIPAATVGNQMRLVVLLSLFVMGCGSAKNECGNRFMVLWPNQNGEYAFRDVEFSTLNSPYQLKSNVAEVFYQSTIRNGGYQGPVARPHLTRSDGVCVPMNAQSSMAAAAYGHMEHIYKFERRLGVLHQLIWPRKIGIDILLQGDPRDTQDNAHYVTDHDLIVIVPSSRARVPIALNPGVIAHEHFHAHFQRHVLNPVKEVLPNVRIEQLDGANLTTYGGVNNFVVRAWNEGLADFYASVYTGRPDSLLDSLDEHIIRGRAVGDLQRCERGVRASRDLSKPLRRLSTTREFVRIAHDPRMNPTAFKAQSYCEGVMLARLLYRIANEEGKSPTAFLKHILLQLNQLQPLLINSYANQVIDLDAIVPVILEHWPLTAAACRDLNSVMSQSTMKRWGRCSGT